MKFIRLKTAPGKVEVPEGMAPVDAVLMGTDGSAVVPGGGTPGENSITTAMLKDGQVTDTKLAANAVGEGNLKGGAVTADKLAAGVLPANATKAKAGLVKQAAKVDDCSAADASGCKASINALLKSLRDAGILATS